MVGEVPDTEGTVQALLRYRRMRPSHALVPYEPHGDSEYISEQELGVAVVTDAGRC